MVFDCDSTNPLDNCRLTGADTTLDWLPRRYSLIAVPKKAPRERAGSTAKELDCRKTGVGQKVGQSKFPGISSSSVDQDENIAEATNIETVPESNIHVYGIKILVFCPIKRPTTVGFAYSCVGTQGRGEFTTIQPFTVAAN